MDKLYMTGDAEESGRIVQYNMTCTNFRESKS